VRTICSYPHLLFNILFFSLTCCVHALFTVVLFWRFCLIIKVSGETIWVCSPARRFFFFFSFPSISVCFCLLWLLIILEQNKQHYSHVQQLGNLSSLALHVLTVVIKLSINHSTAFCYFLLVVTILVSNFVWRDICSNRASSVCGLLDNVCHACEGGFGVDVSPLCVQVPQHLSPGRLLQWCLNKQAQGQNCNEWGWALWITPPLQVSSSVATSRFILWYVRY
jgi:hypothetical protein